MPDTPNLIYGKVYCSRGTVSNSIVTINSNITATTDSEGKYLIDLANMDGYTVDTSYTITAVDEFNDEYVSDTITATEGGQEKDLFLVSRTTDTGYVTGRLQPISIRSIGDKPITLTNPLTVLNMERVYTQKMAKHSSGLTEYFGEAPPGTPTNQAKWRIRRSFFDSDNFQTETKFANGNSKFDKIWDNRVSYSYS